MIVLTLIPIVVAILFILFQTVKIKVKIRDKLTIKINFNILALVLYEDKKRKTRLKDLFSTINIISKYSKIIKYLISKSKISIIIYQPSDYNSSSIFSHIGSLASEQLLLSYLEANSKELNLIKSAIIPKNQAEGKSSYDALFNISFIYLINSALFLLYYIIKSKAKEVINSV